MSEADHPDQKTPANQASPPEGAGNGGIVPPPEHRWPPGQSGNPKGRPSAGATIKEWVNQLAAQALTRKQILAIARNEELPWPKRAAAERILRTLESADLSDLEPWLSGEKTLKELKEEGVNTEVVKSAKITAGQFGESRGIELHDRAGADFDRIMDRTEGKPHQSVEVETKTPLAVQILTPLTNAQPPNNAG